MNIRELEQIYHKCERCGNTRGKVCLDPYEKELYGRNIECVLCDECYHEMEMDV